MGCLRKKEHGFDILDLTLLQKRGLLKQESPQTPDVIDLRVPIATLTPPSPTSTPADVSPFGMLDALATSTPTPTFSSEAPTPELSAMKIKLDDVEYKLERLLERLSALESKLPS